MSSKIFESAVIEAKEKQVKKNVKNNASSQFETEKEIKVESEGRFYAILQVKYTGESFTPDTRHILLGVTPNAENEADIRYAEKILHVLETKLNGVKMSSQTDTDTSDIDEKIRCINNFLGK